MLFGKGYMSGEKERRDRKWKRLKVTAT